MMKKVLLKRRTSILCRHNEQSVIDAVAIVVVSTGTDQRIQVTECRVQGTECRVQGTFRSPRLVDMCVDGIVRAVRHKGHPVTWKKVQEG